MVDRKQNIKKECGADTTFKATPLSQVLVAHACNPATPEAEIKRIKVQSQPRQIVCRTLSRKNPSQKRIGGMAQGIGPEFKLQYCQKKKKPPPTSDLLPPAGPHLLKFPEPVQIGHQLGTIHSAHEPEGHKAHFIFRL
jgi:hypothetical protein